jgi:Arm domain-containing DNA-binding protein/integrase-like protein
MPRIKLTKGVIDELPTPIKDHVYWDVACPGFGVKVTPKGRKVFIVLYRTGGAGSRLRKYTIGPYGRVTLHQARAAAQQIFAAKLEGRDPATERRDARRRMTTDQVHDLLESFIAKHVSQNRSARAISQMLRRELGPYLKRSIHEIGKRDIMDVVSAVEQRGAPVAANKVLKAIKTFLRWCVGRAVLDRSPADDIPMPTKEVARDRVLTDDELARVILSARQIGEPYGGIVELLALTGQRREEVARCVWEEIDLDGRMWSLPNQRTKNAKAHIVHLSDQAIVVLKQAKKQGSLYFQWQGRIRSKTSATESANSMRYPVSRDGVCTICGELAFPEWPALASRRMWPTRYSITNPGRFPAWLPCISGTNSWQSARERSKNGERMSRRLCRPLLQNGDICGEWHESVSHLVEFLAGLEQEFSASRQPDNGVISRRGVDPPRQLSRKLLSTLDRLGCVSFRNAFASI